MAQKNSFIPTSQLLLFRDAFSDSDLVRRDRTAFGATRLVMKIDSQFLKPIPGLSFEEDGSPLLNVMLITLSGEELTGEDPIQEMLTGSPPEGLPRWAFEEFTSVAAAKLARSKSKHAGVLFNISLPAESGLKDVRRWTYNFPTMPAVVVTRRWSQDDRTNAIRAGASDCLEFDETDRTALSRSLWYAVERGRLLWDAVRRSNDRSDDWMSGSRDTAVTESIYGVPPLKIREPREFLALAEDYRSLIKRALKLRFSRTDDDLTDDIERTATLLGRLQATPRDALELHRLAIEPLSKRSGRDRRVVLDEARFVLLGVLARLAGYYRARAVNPPAA